ncbi:MAG: formylmethanofuran dehydrogenase subunit C [Methanobrevibacter sp.]|nr:formylmethanofuran dehydrogenase subunit C [Methanobrevibacter sp.]
MNEVVLTPKEQPYVPIETSTIKPDDFANKSIDEIKDLEVWYGNTSSKIGDFFDVEGESGPTPAETNILIDGDVYNTKRIGQGMTDGKITVNGNVNMYVGAEMEGGIITVNGNADSWAGQDMRGGELIINGNARDYVGSSYRGDWRGMTGGIITIKGNAQNEVAEYMLGGKLIIQGDVRHMPGVHMNGGLLVIEGNVISRPGGEMKNGTIVIKGIVSEFLPGFEYHGIEKDLNIQGESIKGSFYKFKGDFSEKGPDGTVYVAVAGNNHIVP